VPSPWTAARHEFEDVYADLARGKHAWQMAAFALLALLAVATVAVVRLSLAARVTPYIVEVDRLGRARAFGPAEALRRTDTRLVVSQLALFLREVRTVLPSEAAQADVLRRAYAYADAGAAGFLNSYFTDARNNPRLLSRTLARTVEITSVLPVPASAAWRAQWTETEWPLDGSPPRVAAWEAYLAVRITPPETVDAIEDNPLGVHVTSLTWTRVGGGGGT
jgi:type IV secretory pathway TrbF-like protein